MSSSFAFAHFAQDDTKRHQTPFATKVSLKGTESNEPTMLSNARRVTL